MVKRCNGKNVDNNVGGKGNLRDLYIIRYHFLWEGNIVCCLQDYTYVAWASSCHEGRLSSGLIAFSPLLGGISGSWLVSSFWELVGERALGSVEYSWVVVQILLRSQS